MILPYIGCRTRRGTSTRRICVALSRVTTPVKIRFGIVGILCFWIVVLFWPCYLTSCHRCPASLTLNRLDLGDHTTMTSQFAGRVEPLRLRLHPQPEQVVFCFLECQPELLVTHLS